MAGLFEGSSRGSGSGSDRARRIELSFTAIEKTKSWPHRFLVLDVAFFVRHEAQVQPRIGV